MKFDRHDVIDIVIFAVFAIGFLIAAGVMARVT